jgi:peptidoglycan hydrolase CwlO-like protein
MWSDRQAQSPARGRRRRHLTIVAAVVALSMVAPLALAQPLDLERAERRRDQAENRRVQLQRDLDVLLSRIEELKVALEDQSERVDRLDEQVRTERERAAAARARVAEHYRKAYTAGTSSDPLVQLLGGDDLDEVTERTRLLGLLAVDSQRDREVAETASARGEALSTQLQAATAALS